MAVHQEPAGEADLFMEVGAECIVERRLRAVAASSQTLAGEG